jgi:hypothetical protein
VLLSGGAPLKTAPKGFDRNHPEIELLVSGPLELSTLSWHAPASPRIAPVSSVRSFRMPAT